MERRGRGKEREGGGVSQPLRLYQGKREERGRKRHTEGEVGGRWGGGGETHRGVRDEERENGRERWRVGREGGRGRAGRDV